MAEDGPVAKPPSTKVMKRRFTTYEDSAIRRLVYELGRNRWEQIARYIPERTPRQCRERYENYLADQAPNLPWTRNDDALLLHLIGQFGHRWIQIATYFPGRNTNNLKNRWHKVLSRRCSADSQSTDDTTSTPTIQPRPSSSHILNDDWDQNDENEFDWLAEDICP
jgi:hypothetical protein